jgi:hypothetical protein
MIISLAKRIFPICPMFAMLISCGKKVEQGKASETQRQDVKLPNVLSLEASATSNTIRSDAVYSIPRDGDVELPVRIEVAEGSSGNNNVRLQLNVLDDEEEFHCDWKGKGAFYEFDSCADIDGRDLGLNINNIKNFSFPIDQGKKLKLKIAAAPVGTTTKAKVALPVSWK